MCLFAMYFVSVVILVILIIMMTSCIVVDVSIRDICVDVVVAGAGGSKRRYAV